ncbi:unnamed protein product [Moneuplotes crassus]|uniref:Uncharacterized protein n=1 Tax=Euplotes crassus TaxID=5936 RepID=A0AAD1XRX4_EUPCR|nr:unnamed protein product [Moneuplotes crassus]
MCFFFSSMMLVKFSISILRISNSSQPAQAPPRLALNFSLFSEGSFCATYSFCPFSLKIGMISIAILATIQEDFKTPAMLNEIFMLIFLSFKSVSFLAFKTFFTFSWNPSGSNELLMEVNKTKRIHRFPRKYCQILASANWKVDSVHHHTSQCCTSSNHLILNLQCGIHYRNSDLMLTEPILLLKRTLNQELKPLVHQIRYRCRISWMPSFEK